MFDDSMGDVVIVEIVKVPKCNSTVSRKVKLCERVKRPFCPNLDLLDLGNWIFWTDGSDLLSLVMAVSSSTLGDRVLKTPT